MRPTATSAIRRRHWSLVSCSRNAPLACMSRSCQGANRRPRAQGPSSAGTWGILVVVVLAEDPGGISGGLGAAFHAELGEQRRDVVLDGLLGQEDALADLPVGQAFADQLEDLALLVGQVRQRVAFAGLVAEPGHQLAGGARVE